jgi:hypothetical protein
LIVGQLTITNHKSNLDAGILTFQNMFSANVKSISIFWNKLTNFSPQLAAAELGIRTLMAQRMANPDIFALFIP